MYLPASLRNKDREALSEFISEWSFGDLVTTFEGRISISYIPFVFDHENMQLYGHLSQQDFQHLDLDHADDIVVIFKEPGSGHMPGQPKHPSQPHWSFQSIHIKGQPEFINKIQLLTVVDGLTRKHEKQFGNPWGNAQLSEQELDAMLNEIVGVRIHIEEIIGKYKRSHACYIDGNAGTLPYSGSSGSSHSVYKVPPQ